jgi:hypothetical protein
LGMVVSVIIYHSGGKVGIDIAQGAATLGNP